ncbi:unnamed protein product [Soboliphyme baturini]|uniref:Eukaryotic translation initiation factor 3 subunit L n=1 Tax=Soboliphyme baturini TaxID=241478 RepID=A0A183IQ13_9BILA|nr:unnamed protein product [Soboliphyme baturini]
MGQCCIAASRCFVQEQIYDKFVAKAVEKAKKKQIGCPFDEAVNHGPQGNIETSRDIYPPLAAAPPREFEVSASATPASDESSSYRAEPGSAAGITEEVCEYLRYFKRCLLEQNVSEIRSLYEYGFHDLTERYYRDKFWPEEDSVRKVVGNDSEIFLLLYKELYYRYLYAKIQRGPSFDHRWGSYQNYQAFFHDILNSPEPAKLNLPNQWLWDIIDEFVYQFQSFCQYKANPSKRSTEEVEEIMMMESQVWNLYPVMNILYALAQKSQIQEQLLAINERRNPDEVADDFGRHPLYFNLGYFSLIGMLRLHTLLGDYNEAAKTVRNISFDPTGLYNTVPSCLVTLHYYVGFCHMMMRHYQDAISLFVNCLLYIQRTRSVQQQQQQQRSWQYDVITKTNDQIYQLLAICLTLRPQRIDESVQSELAKTMSDKMSRMQRGDLKEIENAFQFGCPKFLSPTVNTFDTGINFAKDMIHIADTKVARRYGEYFIRQINKLVEVSVIVFNVFMVPAAIVASVKRKCQNQI